MAAITAQPVTWKLCARPRQTTDEDNERQESKAGRIPFDRWDRAPKGETNAKQEPGEIAKMAVERNIGGYAIRQLRPQPGARKPGTDRDQCKHCDGRLQQAFLNGWRHFRALCPEPRRRHDAE